MIIRKPYNNEVVFCCAMACVNRVYVVHDYEDHRRGFCKIHYLQYIEFREEIFEACNKDESP